MFWLGCIDERQRRRQYMGQLYTSPTFKLLWVAHHYLGPKGIFIMAHWQACGNNDRQYSPCSPLSTIWKDPVTSFQSWPGHYWLQPMSSISSYCMTLSRQTEHSSRWAKPQNEPTRVETAPKLFGYTDSIFRSYSIDMFASWRTTQLPRYNSLIYNPATDGVDAMAQSWNGENNYINTSFKMISQLLDK